MQWAVTAMGETSDRLPQVPARAGQRALAVISESVWWVTMVDATLVRHHPRTYEDVLAGMPVTQRQLIEGTLTGLRYVCDPAPRSAPGGRHACRSRAKRSSAATAAPAPPLI